ncbi:hypothetical protein [Arabiibacter massiliensis]|uniref:hypothetical protein n=1 Tax=Arabiibacter massiliensis TaxID=1870985 RepID=UPI00117BCC41|nr:hypothetical protein [Arabiibacter massiliensis]
MLEKTISRRGFVMAAGACSLAVLTGVPTQAAHAVSGSTITFTAEGNNCQAYASCGPKSSGSGAFGSVTVLCGSRPDPRTISAGVDLFRYDAYVSGSRVYNPGWVTSFMAQTSNSASGTYYAAGDVWGNTSGGFYVPATPSQYYRMPIPSLAVTEYELNENGLEYGSLLSKKSVGHIPDLIKAVATNEEQGYIYKADWLALGSNDFEAMVDAAQDPGYRYIPVYDIDGTTVLGEFAMYFGVGS